MIIVIGRVITSPDTRADALALSLEHVKRSRIEPGCISHNVHIDCENDSRLLFVEYWEDMAALQAHFQVPASQEFVRKLRKLSPEPTEMKIFNTAPDRS